ncbi:Meckel syndrome type 1 protein isoform 3 [Planoprotostelium fungivorum]|uniref:Meckel syndrome type 1 protein isoform 3 n=1 Tax=Planoprotostelium fungivorum TaxID=1890364 RepID=A0A2P6N363_9EUKA|nr:Meckel syndrome type 1 protein isoform 3 [Planoprotostelium fungivorum]
MVRNVLHRIRADHAPTIHYRTQDQLANLRLKITVKRIYISDEQNWDDNGRLYTFVDSDNKPPTLEMERRLTNSRETPLRNDLASRYLGVPRPRERDPSHEESLPQAGVIEPHEEMMIIFSASSKRTEKDEKKHSEDDDEVWNEFILCYLRAFEDQTLQMRPGLSEEIHSASSIKRRPYSFTSVEGDQYEYTIENVSETDFIAPPAPGADEAQGRAKEKSSKTNEPFLKTKSKKEGTHMVKFLKPTSTMKQLYSFGQIYSAYGFEGDQLYVEYWVDTGIHWRNIGQQPQAGVTQICSPSSREHPLYATCHFGMPLTVEVEAETTIDSPPKIYFQINSLDYWNRRRIEGYCWTDVPLQPANVSFYEKMRCFFIGANSELQDIRYLSGQQQTGIMEQQRGSGMDNLLNRFGFQTETTGRLVVKLNVVTLNQHSNTSAMMPPPSARLCTMGEMAEDESLNTTKKERNNKKMTALQRAHMRLEAKRTMNGSRSMDR